MTRTAWAMLVLLILVTASVVTAHLVVRKVRRDRQGGMKPIPQPMTSVKPGPPPKPLTPEEEWPKLVEEAKEAIAKNNWSLAQLRLERAREVAKSFPSPDLKQAETEYLLAGVYRQQFKDAEAFFACKRALEIRQQKLGEDDLLVADTWRGLAQLYDERGLGDDAERCLKKALEIQRKKADVDDTIIAHTLSEMAKLYLGHQRPADAERLAREALAIQEQKLKPEDPERVVTRLNLGDALYHQEKYDELEKETLETLAVFQKVAGEDHPQVAILLGQLSSVRRHQKKYEEAGKLLWRAVRIQEEKLKEHRDLVVTLLALADVQLAQEMPGEAESQFRRALAVWEKLEPEKQPRLTALSTQLARRFYETGKKDVARAMLKRVLEITDRVRPPVDELTNEILQPLAWLSSEAGELGDAEKQFQRLLLLQKRIYGTKEHPVVFVNLAAYVHVLRLSGKEDEMMKTIETAERLRAGAVSHQRGIARNLREAGQLEKAKEAERMAERIQNQSLLNPFPEPVPLPSFRLPSP